MRDSLKIGVLVSGSGSNLQSIIALIENGSIDAEIVCVISNKAEAFALERAKRHGIPAIHLDHRLFTGREAYDAALVETLREFGVRLVVLAGFMRIITPVLLNAFPNAVMNIHPALLPAGLLLILGIEELVPVAHRGKVGAVLSGFLFVLALLQAVSLCQTFV